MMRGFSWFAALAAFVVVSGLAAVDAAACGNPFWNPHCRDETQVCQNGCPPLPCPNIVSIFDTPQNAFSTSFFAGAIGHCATRGDRNAILACAWQEVVANYPELTGNTCVQQGLFTTPRTSQALDRATAPPPCPAPPLGWGCNTTFRKCLFECPLRDDLTCAQAVSQLDGQGGFFWNAVGHCNGIGSDRTVIGECAWHETIGKYPGMSDSGCVKAQLLASASTNAAIDQVVAAWNNPDILHRCNIPRDAAHPEQGSCNRLETCVPTCPTNGSVTLGCVDSANELDGNGRFFWNAVHHCLRDGMPQNATAVSNCAMSEVLAKYPNLTSQAACVQGRLASSASGSQAINDVVRALGFIAHNKMTVAFTSCANPAGGCPESCDLPTDGSVPPGYFELAIPRNLLDAPPPQGTVFNSPPAHNIGPNEGRVRGDLRMIAKAADPRGCALRASAIQFSLGTAPEAAQAYADLAVTGHKAFAAFKRMPPDEAYCQNLHAQPQTANCPNVGTPPNDAALLDGCHRALNRAYKVANYLRAGQAFQIAQPWFNPDGSLTAAAVAERSRKSADRTALGWIAVSGEDDSPHRPVNAPSSDFPQYDLDVNVEAPLARPPNPNTVKVHTRFIVAQSNAPATTLRPATGWALPTEPPPAISSDAQILLFIHGMDSRAEEADDITRSIFKNRSRSGRNVVVVSMDLPTQGYADNLDFEQVSPLLEIGNRKLTPLPIPVPIPPELMPFIITAFLSVGLPPPPGVIPPFTPIPDFGATGKVPVLDFIENFVVHFAENATLDGKTSIKNNIKAVMGGSLGGNMTFRLGRRANVPWMPNFIVWSPASIWNSLGEGMDITKHLGPWSAWGDANKRDPSDLDDNSPQHLGNRAAFFGGWDKPILPILIPMAQSDTWQSDYWPCKKSAIAAARLDRHETYDSRFQIWHWRLAAEQLLYSHQTIDPTTNQPRFMSNQKRMLLACGTEDHVKYNDICPATMRTAPNMTVTPGKALFLDKTGHSLDNERRAFWAQQVINFLGL